MIYQPIHSYVSETLTYDERRFVLPVSSVCLLPARVGEDLSVFSQDRCAMVFSFFNLIQYCRKQ